MTTARRFILGATLACASVAIPLARRFAPAAPPPPPPPSVTAAVGDHFVGEAVCASCHAREAATWKSSHHQLAMQPASGATVLGDFGGASFHYAGVTSTFFRRADKLVARTDGPDGVLHDYEITDAFGVAPLQQYLVAFPGGRKQALAIAWDSRPRDAGGQRWFHLHPEERITSGDPLHWTGATESWNFMCADCHSTNVRKRYDAATNAYATSFAEISVSCEACHGPGSRHAADARQGLPIALDERRGISWSRDAASGQPHRSRPRDSVREIEMCARCHSRRGLVHEDDVHGQRLADDYRVALLDEDLYFADGQIKDEVYEYGSFVQSRMFAAGVTCTDCHDPHRPELRASGDNLCLKCHAEDKYFTSRHHFHRAGSAGARCVACHMPATTYMVVDARRDHSLRVPRPDLSVTLGVPNACNRCHADRSAGWAARTVEKWYGHTPGGHQRFAEALAAGRQGAPGAQQLLTALIGDPDQPAIARATAVAGLAHQLTPAALASIQRALDDPDALVRRAAVEALADFSPELRGALVAPLLDDAVRTVRVQAAAALAGVAPESLSSSARTALQAATEEFLSAQALNAERPEAHLALARLYAKSQQLDRAESELRRALAIDPGFVPAAVNLADLFRTEGRDSDAEPVLREALTHARDNPALLHTLGLALVRQKRLREAIEWLAAAARLGAENPRFGYVYGVALYSDGRKEEAVDTLEAVVARHPYDRDSLAALATFFGELGNAHKSRQYADRAAQLDPR